MPDKSYFRSLIISISIIVLAAGGFSFGIHYFSEKLAKQGATINQQKSDLYRYAHTPEVLATLKQNGSKAKAYSQLIKNFLPDQDDLFINFGKWMGAEASKRNVQASTNLVNRQTASGYDSLGVATFQTDSGGKIDDIIAFLSQVETASTKYIINLENVDISKVSGYDRVVTRGSVYFQEKKK